MQSKFNFSKLGFILTNWSTFTLMPHIKSLNGLINSLLHSDAADYVKHAKNMVIPLEDFKKYTFWKEDGYSRNCIIRTDEFELILICWNKDCTSPIHGHDNKKCWVYQVDGEMTEVRYKEDAKGTLNESKRIYLTPGKLCFMQDNMGYHMLKNESNQKAITLHLYIKPVEKCAVYSAEKKMFEERFLNYDTIDGEMIGI